MSQSRSTTDTGRQVICIERHINHPIEGVWQSLVDPTELSRWYPLKVVEMNLRVGGALVFDDGEGTSYHGVVQELEPLRVFSFTEGDDLLQIELKPTEDALRLIFTHTFDDATMIDNISKGWNRCLDELEQLLGE